MLLSLDFSRVFMQCILLCAGYATRLYPLTQQQPKALLDVGGKTIADHILDKVRKLGIDVHLVTNELFVTQFQQWARNKKITIISDGTRSNDERLGALRDLQLVLEKAHITDDILLIAGDNLFDFSLNAMAELFHEKKSSVVALYDLRDSAKVVKKYGVAVLDKTNRVVDFEEKPEKPKSTLAATCCYLLRKESVAQLANYMKNPQGENPGDFIRWLAKREAVYGFSFTEPWFDVGSFESLEAARRHYSGVL